MAELVLYKTSTCPFCRKVERFMRENGIVIDERDINADAAAADELIRVGGKRQVPCLFIDGAPLYESDDIIAYLAAQ